MYVVKGGGGQKNCLLVRGGGGGEGGGWREGKYKGYRAFLPAPPLYLVNGP